MNSLIFSDMYWASHPIIHLFFACVSVVVVETPVSRSTVVVGQVVCARQSMINISLIFCL